MKKILISLFAIIALVVGVNVIDIGTAEANKSALNRVFMQKRGGAPTMTAPATTTDGVSSVAVNATTTFPFSTEGVDNVILGLQYTASTSAGYVVLNAQVSNDNLPCDTDPGSCNWFNIGSTLAPVVSGLTEVSSTTQTYTWGVGAGANATTSIALNFNTIGSRYMRFRLTSAGSAGSFWAEVTRKVQNN